MRPAGGPGDCALTKAHPPAAPRIAALEQEDSEGTELEASARGRAVQENAAPVLSHPRP